MQDKYKIYRITCIPNGRVYIGITTLSLGARWRGHVYSCIRSNGKLQRAIRKYGKNSFSMDHIASAFDFNGLLSSERDMIAQYDSFKNGMNCTLGGEGVLGLIWSDGSKIKMGISRTKIWTSKEYRKKISQSQKEAWARKPESEKSAHRARALDTIKKNRSSGLLFRPKLKKPLVRWKGKGWNMRIKTHCPQGHPYSTENTYINPSRKINRVCLICKRKNRNKARDRRVAEKRSKNETVKT